MNRFILAIVVVLAVLGGVFWVSNKKTEAPGTNGKQNAQPSNHVQGLGTTGVTLVEYGDLQCPACGAYYPIVKEIKRHYGDKIIFQFRNFPLLQIHPNAMAAARAAEAASVQGKFWEMHDMLYERQQLWTSLTNVTPIFEGYAKELGLDVTKFRADAASENTNNIINADIKEAQKFGATSTPTFILDGKKIDTNPRSIDEFNKLIDNEIAAKSKS